MYEIVGKNAIIGKGRKIKVAKVPIDSKWYEKLFFEDYLRVNKTLARRVPGFYENDIYLPRMFAPGAEGLELLQDGGRSCINPDKHVTLDMFSVKQTYVEKRKGVGGNTGYPYESRDVYKEVLRDNLEDKKLKKYLEDNDLLVLDVDAWYGRPYGAQSKGLALNELEKSKLLERLGVKHTPVLCVYPIPKHVEKKAKELTDKHFGDYHRPKTVRYYQEVILFPSSVRVPYFSWEHCEDFFEGLKGLNTDLDEFSSELEKDLVHFMEIVPKTLTESTDGYTALGFSEWNFEDCILAPTGLYVTDLESVGFRRARKGYLAYEQELSLYHLRNFFDLKKRIARYQSSATTDDEIVEGLIDALNKSRYFNVELNEKRQNKEKQTNEYLLNVKMECKSGITVKFGKVFGIGHFSET